VSLEVGVVHAHRRKRPAAQPIVRLVRTALRQEGIRDAAVGVVFIGSRRCRRLNREWLGHDYVTDVISFPLGERGRVEGEVYVNLDRAAVQARAYGVSVKDEIARLVAHGVLHLAGYDDRRPADARKMRAAEDRVLGVRRG